MANKRNALLYAAAIVLAYVAFLFSPWGNAFLLWRAERHCRMQTGCVEAIRGGK